LNFFAMVILAALTLSACKSTEKKDFENNQPATSHKIPTIKIENYVNRLFIDLVGRSALEGEITSEADTLRENNLSADARIKLIRKLQTDKLPRIGDSSYWVAYHQRFFDIVKSRMVEGAANGEFTRYVGLANFSLRIARLEGDSIRVYQALEQIARNQAVVDAHYTYRSDSMTINTLFAILMDNNVYDNINMNTFNFVNASFDDLFFRFPSQAEFLTAFDIVEKNIPGSILGNFASTKSEYCRVLTASDEFYEGLIRWTYLSLLGRECTSQEVANHFGSLYETKDLKLLQEQIMKTDEYADF
jgi:hypothetical protein